ncbi:MAG: phasin family protein [Rhodospirillaceae bacterium]
MHGNYFSFFEELNATATAKNQALAARSMFVTGVMEQGYRLWLTLLTTEVTEAMRAAQDLTICKSPEEVVEVQRAWFQSSSARAITSLQGTIEIANFLVKNLQDTMAGYAPKDLPAAPYAALAAPPPKAPALTPAIPAPPPRVAIAPPPPPAPPPVIAAPAPAPAPEPAMAAPAEAAAAAPAKAKAPPRAKKKTV